MGHKSKRGRNKRKRKPPQAEPHRDGQQTYARAGSMQKVEVMRERVDNGEPLFVDGDGEVDLS